MYLGVSSVVGVFLASSTCIVVCGARQAERQLAAAVAAAETAAKAVRRCSNVAVEYAVGLPICDVVWVAAATSGFIIVFSWVFEFYSLLRPGLADRRLTGSASRKQRRIGSVQ